MSRQLDTFDGTTTVSVAVFAGLMIWFALALALSLGGVFDTAAGPIPTTLLAGIALPLMAFGLLYRLSTGFRNTVLTVDIRALILLHSWRMLGLGFVFLYFYDILSGWFALPAGLGDAATAVAALFLGIALYNGKSIARKTIRAWNTFGLLDFVVAVTMGVLTRPGMGIIDDTLTSAPMGEFPLALIPGFAVPFFIITHLIIHLKLAQQDAASQIQSD